MVVRGRLALRAAGFNSRAPRKPFKQKSRATLLGAFHRANAQQRHPQPTAGHANPSTEIQGDVVGASPPRKRPTMSPSTNRGPHEPTDRNPGRRCWGLSTAQTPNNVTLNQPRATRTHRQKSRATLLGHPHRASAQQRHPQLPARHANPSTRNPGRRRWGLSTAQTPNNVTLNQPRATRTHRQKSRATLLGHSHRASAQQRHPQPTAGHANPSTRNDRAKAQQRQTRVSAPSTSARLKRPRRNVARWRRNSRRSS